MQSFMLGTSSNCWSTIIVSCCSLSLCLKARGFNFVLNVVGGGIKVDFFNEILPQSHLVTDVVATVTEATLSVPTGEHYIDQFLLNIFFLPQHQMMFIF